MAKANGNFAGEQLSTQYDYKISMDKVLVAIIFVPEKPIKLKSYQEMLLPELRTLIIN